VPTYEYLCDSCGNRYEKQESFSAKAKQKCPKCGKTANRVIFAPPVVFKGSGFYKTDSRGSDTSVDTGTTAPSVPDLSAASHGHSHGPGGHTHGPDGSHDAAASPDSSDTTSTETAAAG
jgi:putative FmdB family regulatory protein